MTSYDREATARTLGGGMELASMVSLQGGNAIAVHLIRMVGTTEALALRLSVSAVLLSIVLRPPLRTLSPRDIWFLVLFGCSVAGMTGAMYGAITRIPLSLAVTIGLLGPLTVAALSSSNRRDYAWPLLALAGLVVMASSNGLQRGALDFVGVLLALLNATCWGAYIMISADAGQRFGGIHGLTVASIFAAVFWVIFTALTRSGRGSLSSDALMLGVLAGSVFTAGPYMLENLALTRLPRRIFATLASLEPVLAAAIGLLFLGQPVTARVAVGVVIVVSACIGSARAGAANIPLA